MLAKRGPAPVDFQMRDAPPDDDALAKALLGPTGNLKAPTIRVGDTLIVGFDPARYENAFKSNRQET